MEECESLIPFDHHPRTRLMFGPGSVEYVGACSRKLGSRKVLLISDPGVAAAGHEEHVRRILEEAGCVVTVFDEVHENPTTRCVERCVNAARRAGVNALVGLGGGSAMDTAKGCNFVLTNGGRMQDYWGVGKASQPMLPMIAVPTTAGTGSECQSFALITDENTHVKMACGDPKAAARIAILDPVLTLSQPFRVTACSGIDAISHAVESAVTRKRNSFSWIYSREAFRLCGPSLPAVLRESDNLNARGRMLLGAAWAGMAIENSMLGAAHSAANPLTTRCGIIHGHAVGIMLPHIIRFNRRDMAAAATYRELARAIGIAAQPVSPESAADTLAEYVTELLSQAGLPRSLSECGLQPELIPQWAKEGAGQWTAQFNPRAVTEADFVKFYQAAWD